MTRFTLLILIMISLLAGSCSGKKNNTGRIKLIPEKDFISILTDVYLADGMLSLSDIRQRYASYDSISTYITIIENHGYTKTSMDKTMKDYFIKKPQKLIKIYDKVLAVLSQRESLIEKDILLSMTHQENLWTGKEFYFFPGTSGADSSGFKATLWKTGTYALHFSATVFPDDQSVNPRVTGFLCNPDSIATGKRSYIESINYIKDGQQHAYSIIIKVPEKTTLYFEGLLYSFDNNPAVCEIHAWFENITLTYIETVI